MDGKTKESNLGTAVRRKLEKKTLPIVACQRREESHGEAIKTIKDHHGRICHKHAREKTHVSTLLNTLTGREAHRTLFHTEAPPSPTLFLPPLGTFSKGNCCQSANIRTHSPPLILLRAPTGTIASPVVLLGRPGAGSDTQTGLSQHFGWLWWWGWMGGVSTKRGL